MKFTVKLDLNGQIVTDERLREVKLVAQGAMANRFATIVHHNFGWDGEDRPTAWPALSAEYAREFHGGQRIPTLQLTGELQESIQVQDDNIEYSEVFTDNEYALAHQFGDSESNLPPRPFFPLNADGTLTDYSERECVKAAQDAVSRPFH